MIGIYTLAWIPLVFIAVGNGAIREFTYGRCVSELSAHQISCVTGILLFFLYAWLLSSFRSLKTVREAIAVGTIWLVLTITFEFLFGHYVAGHSFARLLADYDVSAGRLWSFVLTAVGLLPYSVYKIRSCIDVSQKIHLSGH
jgi:hypothetical protein